MRVSVLANLLILIVTLILTLILTLTLIVFIFINRKTKQKREEHCSISSTNMPVVSPKKQECVIQQV